MDQSSSSIFDLSAAEKLQLVQDLWDDIASRPHDIPIPDWQKAELDRRKANLQNHSVSKSSWEEIQLRVRSRHGR